ncbi:autotransporter domain-containing protein [Pectinatus sottacetonis]|uniref:autotransporter domain-containing protein n=1 Tax=Pectinatus sottacetonis TaxID=1002795 RepID=UPI0018C49964|nr:autotransporter domain-containing protein [Pectinatus sottacetonis]
MLRLRKKTNYHHVHSIITCILSSCLLSGTAMAANLVAAVPSDYSNSEMGTITGSRVTTKVDNKIITGLQKDLNGDPAIYNYNLFGENYIFQRQYTYSTTDLKPCNAINSNYLDKIMQSGKITSVPNTHAVTATVKNNTGYIYATGYDQGNIGVIASADTKLVENTNKTVNLKNDITKYIGKIDGDKPSVHGEGISIYGNDLYVLATSNKHGTYTDYNDAYVLQYHVNDDGSLAYNSYTRMGKNADQSRMNFYNNHLIVSFIGGYQNYGSGNKETGIYAARISDDPKQRLSLKNCTKINIPDNVKETSADFRDLKILPNGTAYVMAYNLAQSASTINNGHVYQTTVSNLLAEHPQAWKEITSTDQGEWKGWFGKLNAEYYTKRLWLETGNTLNVYTDGAAVPTASWDAKDFSTNPQYYQFNSIAALTPDTVWGDKAALAVSAPEGLTSSSIMTTLTANNNALWKQGDITTPLTASTNYDTDKVISLDDNEALGDLTTNVHAAVYAGSNSDITIGSLKHNLQLQVKDYIGSPSGIYAGNGKNITINAGKLNIITQGYANGNTLTNAIWNDAGKDTTSKITINAPVNITMTGGYGGNGIAIQKTDRFGESSTEALQPSSITINGNTTINGLTNNEWGIPLNPENVYSRFNNAGILTAVNKSQITINGSVDFSIYGNGIAANAANSKITVGGGKIVVPQNMNYGYYALASYLGDINMNTGIDGQTPGTHQVQLTGDLFALKTGTINLALTTSDSYLKGIIDNGGTANLYLQNGAIWTNQKNNRRYKEDNEDIGAGQVSHISYFTGGKDEASRGIIYQNDPNAITLDKYSGHAVVIYKQNDTTINGGGITIATANKTAGQNAMLTLRTGNNGSNENTTLNNLANKLTYKGYNAEKALDGRLEIGEGITSSSAAKTISFAATDNGRGSYNFSEQPEPAEQNQTEFTKQISIYNVDEYKTANVEKTPGVYTFTKDSTLNFQGYDGAGAIRDGYSNPLKIDATGHILTINVNNKNNMFIDALNGSSSKNIDISANQLNLTVNGTKDMSLTKAYGIWKQGESTLSINGLTNINTTAADKSYGVYGTGYGSKIQLAGLKVTVNKDATDGVSIKSDGYHNSQIAINIKNGEIGNNKVQLNGNLYTGAEGKLELALTTNDSILNGISQVKFEPAEDEYSDDHLGTVNLYLQNNAIWHNINYSNTKPNEFEGSCITNLTGGNNSENAGIIFQQDANDVTIANYSGSTKFLYAHDNTAPTHLNGGNIKINKAAENSLVTFITDNNGVTEKNINAVLNALANKLYYTGYISGDRNLNGKAEIAEGLTVSAKSLTIGDIFFDEKTGQGEYKPSPVIQNDQDKTSFTTPITGSADKDKEYSDAYVRKTDGSYVFTKDNTAISTDKNLIAGGAWMPQINSAVSNTDTLNKLHIDLKGHNLAIKTTADTHSTGIAAIGTGSAVDIDHAGKINIDAESTSGGRTAGIFVNNGGIINIHNGDGNLTDKILTVRANTTAKANGAVIKSMNGAPGRSSINIDGLVDVLADGAMTENKGANEAVSAVASDIRIGGGSIRAINGAQQAIRAYGEFVTQNAGRVYINMQEDNEGNGIGAGKNKTIIEGNIDTSGGMGTKGIINIGLSTADSSWTGDYVLNGGSQWYKPGDNIGTVNLWLQNGATWTGCTPGGKLSLLNMQNGATWNNTGATLINSLKSNSTNNIIDMTSKNSGNIAIDSFSGKAMAYYTHDNHSPVIIYGGNIIIDKAAPDSNFTLRTNNDGLNIDSPHAGDKNLVSATLNALANKLYYTAAANNEINLSATAEIAEGLTSSIALRKADITFDKTNKGQGSFIYTPVVDPPNTSPITASLTLTKDRIINASEPNAKSENFVSALYSAINADKQHPMIIDMNDNNLALNANSTNKQAAAIYLGDNQTIKIKNSTNKKLQLNVSNTDTRAVHGIYADGNADLVIEGPIEINQASTKGYSADGIEMNGTIGSTSTLTINGPLTIKNITGKETGLAGDGRNLAGINVVADNDSVTVNGLVDIRGLKGSALQVMGQDAAISVNGGIITAADDTEHNKQYYAAHASKGTININIQNNTPGITKTNLTGDMYLTREYGQKTIEYSGGELIDFNNKGILNTALTTADSSWDGAATYIIDKSDYGKGGYTAHDVGTFNLWLQNGATWTNEVKSSTDNSFAGSHLATLHGSNNSSPNGIIFQKDPHNIIIDSYSGNTTVLYNHDNAIPAAITGGSLQINNADADSKITLCTDNSGIDLSDKNTINNILDALAQKLTYKAYTTGERNLAGIVKITEGLTASSAAKETGSIAFNDTTGQGHVDQATINPTPPNYPESQTKTNITGGIGNDTDKEYLKDGILKDDGSYIFNKNTTITGTQNTALGIVTGIGDKDKKLVIKADSGNILSFKATPTNTTTAAGIVSSGHNGLVNITADTIKIDVSGNSNNNAILAEDAGQISITGSTEINADSAIAITTKKDSTISITGGGSINGKTVIQNDGGKIELGNLSRDLTLTGTINNNGGQIKLGSNVPGKELTINGIVNNIAGGKTVLGTATETVNMTGAINNSNGNVVINLTGTGSHLTGAITTGAYKNKNLLRANMLMVNALSQNPIQPTTTILNLSNGGVWENNDNNIASAITTINGSGGIIQQKSQQTITADILSGDTIVSYDSIYNPTDNSLNISDTLGKFILKGVDGNKENSITIKTDNTNIPSAGLTTTAYKTALTQLANKLDYRGTVITNGKADNLIGYAKINESMTAAWASAPIQFRNGQDNTNTIGTITNSTAVTYGDYETQLMSGVKSAMTSSAMAWRVENNDLMKRMGELRLSPENTGIWVKTYNGKSSSNKNRANYHINYHTIQTGYDRRINDNWRIGAAISHMQGNSSYNYGGNGKNHETNLGLYGIWQGNNNQYIDLILKAGKLTNDYTIYNEDGHKVMGNYDTWGTSMSAEYGKRFHKTNGFYYEPQAEITYSHLNSADYTASSDFTDNTGNYRNMQVQQSSFNSFIGRLGLGIGIENKCNTLFAKVSLNHEFCGSMDTSYNADNNLKTTRQDYNDTWLSFQLGGTVNLTNNVNFYGDFEKTTGGDIKTDWRIDAGFRWNF